MDRMREHFLSVTKADPNLIIGSHFSTDPHNGIDDISITILDFIRAPPDTELAKIMRDQMELKRIHRLSTVLPFGLNTMD